MNLAFSNGIKLKAENSAPVPGFAHTKLNLLLLEQRKRAEQLAIRTEMRIADVGRLPVSDEELSVVLCALFDDAVHIASESERKYLYTAILVRSGQLLISMKASAGKIVLRMKPLTLPTKTAPSFRISRKSRKKSEGISSVRAKRA